MGQRRRDKRHENTLPSLSFSTINAPYVSPARFPILCALAQALIFALHTLKQVSVPYGTQLPHASWPLTKAPICQVFLPVHNSPLSLSPSPPSIPPTHKKNDTLLHSPFSYRPPTPNTSNTHNLHALATSGFCEKRRSSVKNYFFTSFFTKSFCYTCCWAK